MLSDEHLQYILDSALKHGADFAELYLEDKEDMSVDYNGAVSAVSNMRIYGAGVYLIAGTRGVYVYTNDLSESSLMDAVRRGAELLSLSDGRGSCPPFSELSLTNPCPVRLYPGETACADKIRLLAEADRAAHALTPDLAAIKLTCYDRDQRVRILNTEGLVTEDRRVTTRMRFIPVITNEHGTASRFTEFCSAAGYESYQTGAHLKRLELTIRDLAASLTAREAPSARVPVILEGGECTGTFFHEACGHQLETTELLQGGMFFDKRGEQVASDKVTLIDDGTVPGLYGSSRIDDEGMPRQKNVLIENGILKGFMADRLGALKLKLPRTGSGRRQDYAHAPGARMSNTYLAAGSDDEAQMIRDTEEGLFVTKLGGGTGGREFTILADTAYWIRHGEILCRVKGAMLSGRGNETMKKIDRVGKTFVTDETGGAFCGADSGFCPTTTSGPRMRISEMVVGGKGGKL